MYHSLDSCPVCPPHKPPFPSAYALRCHLMDWHGHHNPASYPSRAVQNDQTLRFSSMEFSNVVTGMLDSMNRNIQQGIGNGIGNVLQASAAMASMFGGGNTRSISPMADNNAACASTLSPSTQSVFPPNVRSAIKPSSKPSQHQNMSRRSVIHFKKPIVDPCVVVLSDSSDDEPSLPLFALPPPENNPASKSIKTVAERKMMISSSEGVNDSIASPPTSVSTDPIVQEKEKSHSPPPVASTSGSQTTANTADTDVTEESEKSEEEEEKEEEKEKEEETVATTHVNMIKPTVNRKKPKTKKAKGIVRRVLQKRKANVSKKPCTRSHH